MNGGTGAVALLMTGLVLLGVTTGASHELPPGVAHPEHNGATAQLVPGSAAFALQPIETSASAAAGKLPQLHLPVLGGAAKPWTSTELNNDPGNFQFAIVTDRAGGIRPGIFDEAVKKLNLLQPEFVMSVGDLIKGYTRDEAQLKLEWEEFEGLVAGLEMPFFYVPGNHDVSNPVQKAEWHRRFGPNYYHFVYGDVLFLCLDTEDAASGRLSKEQIEYFRQALEENQDVRWTLLFMHRPIWIKAELHELSEKDKSDREVLEKSGWLAMEQMLHDRRYTVYAGHVHSYTKYMRHDNKYYILATTGGGSQMRGPEAYGEFDHVSWITMTDDGPVMANLLLDGIYDENLRTEEVATLVRATIARAVEAQAAVTEPLPFTSASLNLRLNNSAKVPLKLELQAPENDTIKYNPKTVQITVPPKSVKFVEFTANASAVQDEEQLENQTVQWKATYELSENAPVTVEGREALVFDAKRLVRRAPAGMAIDGNFEEWTDLWSAEQPFRQLIGHRKAWLGEKDATVQLATAYDDEFLYVAARVLDDEIVPLKAGEEPSLKAADHLRVYLAPVTGDQLTKGDNETTRTAASTAGSQKGASEQSNDENDLNRSIIQVIAAPAESQTSCTVIIPHKQQVTAACRTTTSGYEMEMAIPIELLQEQGAQPWKYFRMNLKVNDMDITAKRRAELWWKPEWKKAGSDPQSGLFVRE